MPDNKYDCPEIKQEKHLQLYDAILQIDEITNDLRRIFLRITGKDEPNECLKNIDGPPPLEVILNDGPDWIKSRISKSHIMIRQIVEALF